MTLAITPITPSPISTSQTEQHNPCPGSKSKKKDTKLLLKDQLAHSGLSSASHSTHIHIQPQTSIRPPPFTTTPSTSSTQHPITAPSSIGPSHSWKTQDWMLTYSGIAFSRTIVPTFSSVYKNWRLNATLTTTTSSKPPSSLPMPEAQVVLPPKSSPMCPLPNDLPVPPYPFLFPLIPTSRLAHDLTAGPALPPGHHLQLKITIHPLPARSVTDDLRSTMLHAPKRTPASGVLRKDTFPLNVQTLTLGANPTTAGVSAHTNTG